MPGIPLPNLTLAAPSQSSASTPFSSPFAVGGAASASGGIPSFMWIAFAALAAIYIYKRV